MKLFSKLWLMMCLFVIAGASWAKPMTFSDTVATRDQAIEAITVFHAEHKKVKDALASLWENGGKNDAIWATMEQEAETVLKYAVVVESYYTKTPMSEVYKSAVRDGDGVTANVRFNANKLGWPGGGTSVNDDMLEARRDHYLNRMVYYTVRIHDQEEDPQFDLTQFLAVLELEIPLV